MYNADNVTPPPAAAAIPLCCCHYIVVLWIRTFCVWYTPCTDPWKRDPCCAAHSKSQEEAGPALKRRKCMPVLHVHTQHQSLRVKRRKREREGRADISSRGDLVFDGHFGIEHFRQSMVGVCVATVAAAAATGPRDDFAKSIVFGTIKGGGCSVPTSASA